MHLMIIKNGQSVSQSFFSILVVVIATLLFAGTTKAAAQLFAQNQTISGDGQIYLHPDKKFSVLVPNGAQIVDAEGSVDLAMRSREGWSINIQSSPTNLSVALEQMAGGFEARFVGPDKTWTEKLSGRLLNDNSYSGLYEGSGARIQVVIQRTRLWDFVLMFMAPRESFERTTAIFQRVLSSFRPLGPEDSQDAISGADRALNLPDKTLEAPPSNQVNRYSDAALGYAISYPAYWVVSNPDEFTSVFTGKPGSDAGYAIVSIRNVATDNSIAPKGAAEGMLQQLKAQMAYADANVRHEQPIAITIGEGDRKVAGIQMVSTFRRGDIGFRQWSIVVPRPDSYVVHVWTYTAPLDRFQKFQDVAEMMVGSMVLIPAITQ